MYIPRCVCCIYQRCVCIVSLINCKQPFPHTNTGTPPHTQTQTNPHKPIPLLPHAFQYVTDASSSPPPLPLHSPQTHPHTPPPPSRPPPTLPPTPPPPHPTPHTPVTTTPPQAPSNVSPALPFPAHLPATIDIDGALRKTHPTLEPPRQSCRAPWQFHTIAKTLLLPGLRPGGWIQRPLGRPGCPHGGCRDLTG